MTLRITSDFPTISKKSLILGYTNVSKTIWHASICLEIASNLPMLLQGVLSLVQTLLLLPKQSLLTVPNARVGPRKAVDVNLPASDVPPVEAEVANAIMLNAVAVVD